MIPSDLRQETNKKLNAREKIRHLDVVGVSMLTGICPFMFKVMADNKALL
jgi:hypothetical protein